MGISMRSTQRLSVAASLLLVLALLAPAALGAEETTVGRFVQDLARLKSLTATDARVAADSLATVGVQLPTGLDFNKRLTEADVTLISGAAGLRVTTTTPEAPFDAPKVERFFVAFGPELGIRTERSADTTDAGSDPRTTRRTTEHRGCKGKNKPHRSRPDHCRDDHS